MLRLRGRQMSITFFYNVLYIVLLTLLYLKRFDAT
ncbi:hypothetical protein ABIB44_002387 [Hymenobacter sp. UYCo722]